MEGVGIDLLEIERLERALERRPRLAERLFTAGGRDYASARARPGLPPAGGFWAQEAVAKALELRVWDPHDVEVVGGGGPPEIRLSGHADARARELGVAVRVSLTHTHGLAGAAGGGGGVPHPPA